MSILILYALGERKPRKTIRDSLFCFSEYDKKNQYYYLNVLGIQAMDYFMDLNLDQHTFSAIIVHYSCISQRYDQRWWGVHKSKIVDILQSFECEKILIPQDEYNYTKSLQEFISMAGIDKIYTCSSEEDYEKLYPSTLGYSRISTVFTGYVDEKTLKEINKKQVKNSKRKIDIGYRARKLPYWLGKHGQLKIELADKFNDYLSKCETGLVTDINNTGLQNEKVLLGNDWIDFLLNCRTMLGCLGGSGLVDYDGSIKEKVDDYCQLHPDAKFEECEKECFAGLDNYIHLFALSPRHFECAMTKTCQVLVEGDYFGVFLPNIDYIEIKRDFSNIEDVISKIKDKEYCEQIADNCYCHVIEGGKYTYAKFVQMIVGEISNAPEIGIDRKKKIERVCEYSDIIATGQSDFLQLHYISIVGIKNAIKPAEIKERFKYNANKMKNKMALLFWGCVRIVKKTPIRNTRLYCFLREKYKSYREIQRKK